MRNFIYTAKEKLFFSEKKTFTCRMKFQVSSSLYHGINSDALTKYKS